METFILENRTWHWTQRERIEAMKLALHGARALHSAEIRIAQGLLLEAGPEIPESAVDEELTELPTGIFEAIAVKSDDPVRMDRIRAQRQQRKEETKAEKERREGLEAEGRRMNAFRDARQRLRGRPSSKQPKKR